jgi:hypothetical protein
MAAPGLVWPCLVWPCLWSRVVGAGSGLAVGWQWSARALGGRLRGGGVGWSWAEGGASALLCFSLWGAEGRRAVVEAILQPQCVLTAGPLGLISRPNGEGVELKRARSLLLLRLHATNPSPHHPRQRLLLSLLSLRARPGRGCMHARRVACIPVLSRHDGP